MANLSNINNVLRVSSDLRVGINTDAASYALEIGGTNSGIKLKNSGGSGKVYSLLSDTAGNFQIYDDAAASGRLVISSGGDATFAGSITVGAGNSSIAGDLYFGVNADIFKSSGTLMITASDSTFAGELNVKNASSRFISLNYEDSINSIISHNGSSYGLENLNVRGDNIYFYTDYEASSPKGNITLTLQNNHNAKFEGNVGIGLGPSTYSLHIYKSNPIALIQAANTSGAAQVQFFPRDASNVAHLQSIKGVDSNLTFLTGGNSGNSYVPTEKMRIDSNGNVSIKEGKLSIGQSSENNIAYTTGETWIGSNGLRYNSGSDTFARSSAASQAAMMVLTTTADVEFYAQPSTSQTGTYALSPKMVIKGATGSVGIGTTSPQRKLHVINSADTFIARFTGGASSDVNIGIFGNSASNFGSIGTESADRFSLFTSGYDRLNIAATGNVGIGVTNPETARLLVRGSTNDSTSQIFQAANLGGATKYVVRADGDNKWYKSDNSQSMVLTSGGDVGIGVTGPSAKLQVVGTTGLPATSGTTFTGTMRLQVAGGYGTAMDFGAVGPATGTQWIQVTDASNQALHYPLLLQPNGGTVGIGTTSPIEKLQVEGGAYINGRDIGKGVNLATSQGWTALSAGNVNSVLGYFGGNFSKNGASNENEIIWGTNQANQRTLIWKSTNNDTGSDGDGGWDKGISTGNDNMGYVSYVYVKRTNASTNGSFYFGCSGGNTLNLAGTAIGNPYFMALNVGSFPLNVWCLAIGHIQANNDSNTINNPETGVYRLDTGIKLASGTSYKMGTNGGSQSHRTYLYYSTDPVSTLSWVDPGFYAIDGTQPTMGELLNTNGLPSVSEASLWTRKTIDSNVVITGNIAITALTHTYTYPAPHALYISGGFTTTPASSGVAYSAHFTMFVDGTTQALVDQHDTPPEWWRQGFAFMTQDLTSGSHTITVNALNQDGNFNIVGGGGGGGGIYSQIVYRIIPL